MRNQATNKFNYLTVIQGNYGYGHGWEDLSHCQGEGRRKAARQDLKAYREACPGVPHRLINRRERRN